MTDDKLTSTIQRELERLANGTQAAIQQRFFKTGPGEYGEGDGFRGIRVPVLRKLVPKYLELSLTEARCLFQSPFHEDRMLTLFILIKQYYRGDSGTRGAIHRLYLEQSGRVNNWDLVDASAPHLIGHYLAERPKGLLTRLAASENLWERRMAILATFHFIKRGDYDETLKVAGLLLGDPEDLIHKAVGWMLREVGKREATVAEAFLQTNYRTMPRTMLRYAIERFPEARRQAYLRGEIL